MELLLLTTDPTPASVLPAVDLLPVRIRSAPPEAASLVTSGPYDLLLLDARHDLAAARSLCRLLGADGLAVSILAIVTEGGMVAIGPGVGCRGRRAGQRRARPRCTPGCGCSPPAPPARPTPG